MKYLCLAIALSTIMTACQSSSVIVTERVKTSTTEPAVTIDVSPIRDPSVAATATKIPTTTPTPTRRPSATQMKSPQPVLLWQDEFTENPTFQYQILGKVTWKSDEQNVILGTSGLPTDNKIYYTISNDNNLVVEGRINVPMRNYSWYESVAIALSGTADEYWATFLFGDTGEYDKVLSIMENDTWGTQHKFTPSPGWYWIKVFVDYDLSVMRMKAWSETGAEPKNWQVSRSLQRGWAANQVGFRHFGQGVVVDDLSIYLVE
jgi:hypothetical protein